MSRKIFAAATLAACLAAGSAFAQTTGSTSDAGGTTASGGSVSGDQNVGGATYKSDDERMMYENNKSMFAPFFTDDSMMEMKSEEEVHAAYRAMNTDDQAKLKASCDQAMGNRGSYRTMTMGLCEQIGMM